MLQSLPTQTGRWRSNPSRWRRLPEVIAIFITTHKILVRVAVGQQLTTAKLRTDMQSENSSHRSSAIGTPAAELDIDVALVYRLLAQQHPDLAHLPIEPVDAGWDNTMFRLGDTVWRVAIGYWASRQPKTRSDGRENITSYF
jgi:hypothetical protein